MIEFWPDCCGYKLQVDDEDAGKWIRCPYCNARVQVPLKKTEADPLAEAISELPGDLATPSSTEITGPAFGKGAGGFDPMRIAVKAGLVVVFVLVAAVAFRQVREFVESRRSRPAPAPRPVQARPAEPQSPKSFDVLAALPSSQMGAFVDSYPPDLKVYVHAIENPALDRPELLDLSAMEDKGRTPREVQLPAGTYWVFVAARLNDPELMKQPGYPGLRRKLETSGELQAAADYFLVDGASRLEYRETPGGIGMLLKCYRVMVEQGKWTPVTCYLLPAGPAAQLLDMLPTTHRYRVDDREVLPELVYHGVPTEEQPALVEMLRRYGKAVRAEPDTGLWRILQITPWGLMSPGVGAAGVGMWEEPKRSK